MVVFELELCMLSDLLSGR